MCAIEQKRSIYMCKTEVLAFEQLELNYQKRKDASGKYNVNIFFWGWYVLPDILCSPTQSWGSELPYIDGKKEPGTFELADECSTTELTLLL